MEFLVAATSTNLMEPNSLLHISFLLKVQKEAKPVQTNMVALSPNLALVSLVTLLEPVAAAGGLPAPLWLDPIQIRLLASQPGVTEQSGSASPGFAV